MDKLLKVVIGSPHFEGFFRYADEQESFINFIPSIRDYYMDGRNRKLLGNEVLAFEAVTSQRTFWPLYMDMNNRLIPQIAGS